MIDWKKWRHVTKLDPDKPLTKKDVAAIVDSGTDAVMISGTQNITKDNVASLVDMLKEYSIPKVLEPAGAAGLRDDLDFLFIPSVINTDMAFWMMGAHKLWVQHFPVDWEKVVPEAYIVLNPKSAVAMVTKSKTDLSASDAAAYALCAEKFFHFPVVYIEYSGTYGDPELVKTVKEKSPRVPAVLWRRDQLARKGRGNGPVRRYDRRGQRRVRERRHREAKGNDRQINRLLLLFK